MQGYTSLDWFLDRDIVESSLKPLERIIPATKGLTAVVGTVRPTGALHGRKLFNSAAVIRDGELLGFADKTLLPEYDVFDDPRYFQSGEQRRLFEVGKERLGVVVCEDFWNDKTFWKERLYAHDPTDEVIELGATVIVSPNASPFNKGKMGERCKMVSHRSKAVGAAGGLRQPRRRQRRHPLRRRVARHRLPRRDDPASAALRGVRRHRRRSTAACATSAACPATTWRRSGKRSS